MGVRTTEEEDMAITKKEKDREHEVSVEEIPDAD